MASGGGNCQERRGASKVRRYWEVEAAGCRRPSVDIPTTTSQLAPVAELLSKSLGRTVRERRVRCGLSQEELAARAGIHRTYVSSIEHGKVRVGLDFAKKVADGLGIPLSELIAEAEGEVRRANKRSDRWPNCSWLASHEQNGGKGLKVTRASLLGSRAVIIAAHITPA